ncbi:hypothetical protein [Solicola sp. PLA-1-18]|uniref:hypothetical protein n=1 Tax=Solicola sp. PLA-1-18 TaxID=3380532 RepID=UPI003B7F444B
MPSPKYVVTAALVTLTTTPAVVPNPTYEKRYTKGDVLPDWVSAADLARLQELGYVQTVA